MREKLFGNGRKTGVLLVAGIICGAVIAGPGASIAQKAMNLTTTSGDKRYVKRGETIAAGKTVETKIDKFTSTTFSPIATAKLNAPGVGWLVINATLSAKDDSTTAGDGKLQYRLAVNDTALTTSAESYELFLPDGPTARENGAVTGVIKTTAKGEYRVQLQAQEAATGTGSTILGRNVSVQFVPKGKLPKTKPTKKVPAA
jgi:hypothetical protein